MDERSAISGRPSACAILKAMNDVPENNVADGRSESPSDARDGWSRLLPTRKRLIAYTTTFVAVIVLNVQFSFGFGGAGFVGLVTFGLCGCLVLAIVPTLMGSFRWARMLAAIGVAAILGFVVAYNVIWSKRGETEKSGQRIVQALMAYKAANGTYPADLAELIPSHLQNIPSTSMGFINHPEFFYYRRASDGEFTLMFPLPFFMQCKYASDKGIWFAHD